MIDIFLAEGFEEIEALCPLDIMRRAGLEVRTVGVGGKLIRGAHGITVEADITDSEYVYSSPEMVFLPGGMPGTLNLAASEVVTDAVKRAHADQKYIAAICADPMILGKRGLLYGKQAVCYPGFEDRLVGAFVPDKKVVLDGKILTAKGMGAALEMGLEIVRIYRGKDFADNLKHAVIAD